MQCAVVVHEHQILPCLGVYGRGLCGHRMSYDPRRYTSIARRCKLPELSQTPLLVNYKESLGETQ